MSVILVVDDEPALLDVVSDFVEMLGYEVARAHDGEEALTVARTRKPALVITDHMMPRRTGLALIKAMRGDERLCDVPAVIMSAVHPIGIDRRDTYIKKPFDLGDLERIVRNALHEEPRIVGDGIAEAPNIPLDGEEMARWLAHEVKQPIAAARAHVQLVERTLDDPVRAKDHLQRVTALLRRIDQLVNALLDAARLAEGNLTARLAPADLVEFLESHVREMRSVETGSTLILKVPNEPVPAAFDRLLLGQLLSNLISNATKHAATHDPIEVKLAAQGSDLVISVVDHGRGIPEKQLPHLFDRFRSGDDGVGHGLGLFIASQIARLHGGELTCESQVGVGSSFSVRLPRSTQTPASSAAT